MVRGGHVGVRFEGARCNGGERRVSALADGHVLACSVGGIVRSVAIVGGHSVPKGAKGIGDTAQHRSAIDFIVSLEGNAKRTGSP